MNALVEFFSDEAGQQRRNWLDSNVNALADTVRYYAGPYAPGYAARAAAEMNPVQDIGNALADARAGDYVGALTNTATAVAPVVAGKIAKAYNPRMADDAVQWIEDALTGISVNPTRTGVGDAVGGFVGSEYGGTGVDPFGGVVPRAPFIPDTGPAKYRDDPLGYQATKMDRPTRDIDVKVQDLGINLDRTPASIEDLQGHAVLPIFGDKTSGGKNILGIDDVEFSRPVTTEGGVDFLRGAAHQQDDAIWASNPNIMSRLSNRVSDVANETGRPVSGITVSMAPDAADFTSFGGAAMAEMVQQAKITKKAAREFDKGIRAAYPDFPGTHSPNLRSWFEKTTPDARKMFIRTSEKAPWQAAGYPAPGKMRYAVADDTQKWLPSGQAGLGIMRFPDELPLISNPSVPHSTYGAQGTGEYVGTMDPVAQTEIFRDFFSDPAVTTKNGKPVPASNQVYTQKLRLPYQVVDQELVDRIMTIQGHQR